LLSFGGLMRTIIGAITLETMINLASKTGIANRIISQAANRAEDVADFLDKIVERLEEKPNDLPMQ